MTKFNYLRGEPDYYINGGDVKLDSEDEVFDYVSEIRKTAQRVIPQEPYTEHESMLFENEVFKFKDPENPELVISLKISKTDNRNVYDVYQSQISKQSSDIIDELKSKKHGTQLGKYIYIYVGTKLAKEGKTLVSHKIDKTHNNPSDRAKFVWNSLTNMGLARFDKNENRFKMINGKLLEYFDEIPNDISSGCGLMNSTNKSKKNTKKELGFKDRVISILESIFY